MTRTLASSLALAALALSLGFSPAEAQAKRCFPINELDGWRASDASTIYLRVAQTQYYRLDLGNMCPLLTDKGAHIVLKARGSDLLCSAADMDLKVARDTHGSLASPCIVKAMRPLTPAEAQALPKGFQGM